MLMTNTHAFTNPSDEHICALLSKLAYEDLTPNFDFNNLDKTQYTASEILYLKENFSVESVKNDTDTGFFGCFLKNKNNNKIYYTIRGTTLNDNKDIVADNEILIKGMSIQQFISAYNYYVEKTTPNGETFYKFAYTNTQPDSDFNKAYVADYDNNIFYYLEEHTGSGKISKENITLTGHSLGGHLSGMIAHCTQDNAIIFNAPAYTGGSGNPFNLQFVDDKLLQNRETYYTALIADLLDPDTQTTHNIHHIYNGNYLELIGAGIVGKWNYSTEINGIDDALISPEEISRQHGINLLNDTYYVYDTIKGIINDKNVLQNSNNIDIETAFDTVYRAYCLSNGKENTILSYTDSMKVRGFADEVSAWLQEYASYNVLIDVKNPSTKINSIDGTDGNDLMFLENGKDTVYAESGNDIIYATEIQKSIGTPDLFSVDKKIYLGAGSDTFYGFNGDDYVDGGKNDDEDTSSDTNIVYLGAGSDDYYGGAGNDIVDGGSGDTGNINKTLYNGIEYFMTDIASDENEINLGAGNDKYTGGIGKDIVYTGNGNDIINTSAGDDKVNAWDTNSDNDTNIVYLGAGSDEFEGSNGIDIVDGGSGATGDFKTNTALMTDSEFDTNTINLGGGNDIYTGGDGIDIIYGGYGDDTIKTGRGKDIVDGGSGNDIIEGGKGNDTLDGSSGDDTYIWNNGDGFDEIKDTSGNNTIKFGENITKENLTFTYDGSGGMEIFINKNQDQGMHILSSYSTNKIEFSDKTTLDINNDGLTLVQKNTDESIVGTNGNDTIYGNKGNDIINGGSGEDIYVWNLGDDLDTITDYSENNRIRFGAGILLSDLSFTQNGRDLYINVKNDNSQGVILKEYFNYNGNISNNLNILEMEEEQKNYNIGNLDIELMHYDTPENNKIYSTNGNNILHNGKGNDSVYLKDGSYTYLWNLGDGLDTFIFNNLDNGKTGMIKFGAEISAQDLTFSVINNKDIKITVKGDENQGIILSNVYNKNFLNRLDKIIFSDGNEFLLKDMKMTVNSPNGTIYNDIIHYTEGGTINGGEGNDEIHGGNKIDKINGGNGDDYLYGYGDDDILSGGNDNDHLYGGEGNDTLNGGKGNDAYYWNIGDGLDIIEEYYDESGDKLVFGPGVKYEDLKFSSYYEAGNYGIKITLKDDSSQGIIIRSQMKYAERGASESDKGYGIEYLTFDNGQTINIKEIGLELYNENSPSIDGTPYNDIIHASDQTTMYGGNGDDQYIYTLNDGICTIDDSSGNNDTLIFGEGITLDQLSYYKYRENLRIIVEDNKFITIENHYSSNEGYQGRIEYLEFSDGTRINTDQAVNQMIQAMNSFGADTSSTTNTLSNPTQDVSDMYSLAASQDLTRKAI